MTRAEHTDTSQADKRIAARRPASQVPAITGIRLSPQGTKATLINISTSGVLVESPTSLKPTSTVTVIFEGTFSPQSMPSRVARTTVVGIGKDGGLRYHIGLSFTSPIPLESLGEPAASQPAPAPQETAEPIPAAAAPTPTAEPAPIENRW
jgi:hypothetical protein